MARCGSGHVALRTFVAAPATPTRSCPGPWRTSAPRPRHWANRCSSATAARTCGYWPTDRWRRLTLLAAAGGDARPRAAAAIDLPSRVADNLFWLGPARRAGRKLRAIAAQHLHAVDQRSRRREASSELGVLFRALTAAIACRRLNPPRIDDSVPRMELRAAGVSCTTATPRQPAARCWRR